MAKAYSEDMRERVIKKKKQQGKEIKEIMKELWVSVRDTSPYRVLTSDFQSGLNHRQFGLPSMANDSCTRDCSDILLHNKKWSKRFKRKARLGAQIRLLNGLKHSRRSQ